MQPPNDDKDVVELLLGWITDMPSVVDKKGNPIHIAPSLVSDLLNRKVDVPKAIKNICSTRKVLTEAKKHFEYQVLPYLNPIVSDDMFEAMGKAVEGDEIMASKKKKELASLLENGKEAEFLGQLLMYVINRENRLSNKPVVSEDIPLQLTRLPVIAHDSVMLKHIEDDAIEKIVELYASTPKQVFIAMDKEGSYTPKTQKILEATKVLQLSPGAGALFGRTWNDVERT